MSDISESVISYEVMEAIKQNKGFAVILAGSDSDRPHIDKLSAALKEYQVPHQVRICSAHKQPEELQKLVRAYDSMGTLAYIAVAGGTDALSGTVSFHSINPVISCPPDAPNDTCLRNPPGSSNAYMPNPKNAARFVAQMFLHLPDTPYRKLLETEKTKKVLALEKADVELRKYPYQPQEVKK
jgi:phosphoribosylaminoimidazole carboxylase PurE protein